MFAYKDIHDCPAGKYLDVIIKDDYSCIAKNRTIVKALSIDLSKQYERLKDQVIDEFGIDRETEDLFFKKRALAELICEFYITDKRQYLGKIDLLKKEIKDIENRLIEELDNINIKKSIARNNRGLHKWSGRDPRNITVFEYYNDLNDLQDEISKQKKKQKQKN